MKCEICEKEILRDSQCINYKYYHNNCIENLQQENKQLKEELKCTIGIVEHNIIISKKNREIHQLKDNWNKLKVYIKTEIPEDVFIDTEWFVSILDKMQELERSDSNE